MKNTFEKSKKIFSEGLDYLVKDEFIHAEKKFLESYKLTPDRISIVSNLIQLYIKLENPIKLSDFLKKNNNFEDTFDFNIGLGFLNFFNRNHKVSLNICKELKPQNLKQQVQAINLKIKNLDVLNKFDEVIILYKEILSLEKDNHINYYNFGTFYLKIGNPEQALIYLHKASEIKKDFPGLLWNISLCELKLGNFKKGYSLFDYRWKNKDQNQKYQSIKELKDLKDLSSSRVLFWGDGGFGDNLQCSRFVNYLSNSNANLTIATHIKLKKLLDNLNKDIKVISYEEVAEQDYDFQLSLGSIPKLLEFKKFEEVPYYQLNIKENLSKQVLNLSKNKLNIGLGWQGNPNYPDDEYRSIPFNKFKGIINSEKFKFFKLQKDLKTEESEEFYSYTNIEDLGKKDFYDLSICLKELDIIASSDTSIIHLCGILNIKAYLLLNYNSDWRWFFDKDKTIWYPSIQIIKQKKINDWSYVFEKLETELTNLYKNKFKP